MPNDDRKAIDVLTDTWEATGEWFRRRPVAIIGTLTGAMIFCVLIGYLFVNQNTNQADIRQVQSAFCNGSAPYDTQTEINCRHLLDQLLKNPTPAQAERLRDIVRESP